MHGIIKVVSNVREKQVKDSYFYVYIETHYPSPFYRFRRFETEPEHDFGYFAGNKPSFFVQVFDEINLEDSENDN